MASFNIAWLIDKRQFRSLTGVEAARGDRGLIHKTLAGVRD